MVGYRPLGMQALCPACLLSSNNAGHHELTSTHSTLSSILVRADRALCHQSGPKAVAPISHRQAG